MNRYLTSPITFILFICFAIGFIRSGSNVKELYKIAEKHEYNKQFEEAATIYKKLLKIEPDNPNFNFKYAINIIQAHVDTPVLTYLEKAAEKASHRYRPRYKSETAPFITYYYAGKEAHYLGEFSKAKSYYDLFLAEASTHLYPRQIKDARLQQQYANSGIKEKARQINVLNTPFGKNIFPDSYHSPIVSPDESLIIFTAPHEQFEEEEPNDDMFYIKKVAGEWQKPVAFDKSFNSRSQEASVSISPDGQTFVFFRENGNNGELFFSKLENDSVWGKPHRFPRPINSLAYESHGSFSFDDSTFFFTSNRSGGVGGLDIYYVKKQPDGKWGEVVNAGEQVNSPYNEESPFLYSSTQTLFFSSDRPESVGGFDVFTAHFADSGFTKAVNAGYPVNTAYNDLFYTHALDNLHGYISQNSKRNGAFEMRLVEYIENEQQPDVVLNWVALDENGDSLADLPVMIFMFDEQTPIDSTVTNSVNGTFAVNLYSGKKYFAAFQKDSSVYFSQPFYIDENFSGSSFNNNIELDPMVIQDSAFRQDTSRFAVFKENIRSNTLSDTSSLYLNLFVAMQGETTIDTITREQTNTSLVDLRIEEVPKIAKDTPVLVVNEPPKVFFVPPVEEDLGAKADSLMLVAYAAFESEDYIEAASLFEKASVLYKDDGDINKQIESLTMAGRSFQTIEAFTEALSYHEDALELIQLIGDKRSEAEKLEEMGDVGMSALREEQAIAYLSQAVVLLQELGDKKGENQVNKKISEAYYQKNDFDNAKESFIRLQQTSLLLGDKDSEAYANYMLGNISKHKNELDSAQFFYEVALKILEDVDNSTLKGKVFSELGNVNYSKAELKQSEELYLKAIAEFKKAGNQAGVARAMFNLGSIHSQLEDFDQALSFLTQSIAIAEETNDNELLAHNNLLMSQIHERLNAFDQAFMFYSKFLKASGHDTQNDNFLINHQEIKYQNEKTDIGELRQRLRDKQIKVDLEKEMRQKTITGLEVDKKNKELMLSIIIAIIASSVLLALYVMWRLRKNHSFNLTLRMKNRLIVNQRKEITEQKQALSEMELILEKLSIVASQTANAVAILTPNFKVEWFNEMFNHLFAPDKEKDHHFVSDFVDTSSHVYFEECVSQQKPVAFEIEKKIVGGNQRWVKQSLTPIVEDGEISKIISLDSDIDMLKKAEFEILAQTIEIEKHRDEIAMQRDYALDQKDEISRQRDEVETMIDELQRTQKKLIEQEKMASLGNLVAGVAHEINTPIGICLAASSSLQEKTQRIAGAFKNKKMSQKDLFHFLKQTYESSKLIVANLQRTGELVQSFKRVSVDEVTEQKRKFNLNEYINELFKSLSPKLRERQTKLEVVCDESIELDSYPGMFAQIFTNFTINSVAHAFADKPKGTIKITCSVEGDNFTIIFEDDGAGMEEEVRKKAFNPFFTTNMQAGTGLGLNIVYNLVTQKLKGEISCESKPGEGARFVVTAPIVSE